jgi:ATP-dependent DNA ligase
LLRRLKERERDEGLSVSLKRAKAVFIEPMLLRKEQGASARRPEWMYEIKLDGYRALAIKSGGAV